MSLLEATKKKALAAVWPYSSSTYSYSSNPVDRLCQLHQDLLLFVKDDDVALAKRFRRSRGEPLWRETVGRFFLQRGEGPQEDSGSSTSTGKTSIGTDSTIAEVKSSAASASSSPCPQHKMEMAALSFRENLIQMASSDENDDTTASTSPSNATTAASTTTAIAIGPPPSSPRRSSNTTTISWRDLEKALVETIREIGKLVVDCQPNHQHHHQRSTITTTAGLLRSDPVFEYFCEAAMLPLLIDIARAKPRELNKLHKQQSSSNNSNTTYNAPTSFHRIVWSPAAKSQVLETVTLLVSCLRDVSALYFILSQNSVNQLVSCILPLQKWTDPAIQLLLPNYVDLLKHLTLQLTASPHLFPCFIISSSSCRHGHNSIVNQRSGVGVEGVIEQEDSFPLLTALLETATFAYAQSDSFVHASCLNSLVILLRLTPVHQWLTQCQQQLVQLQLQQKMKLQQHTQPNNKNNEKKDGNNEAPPQSTDDEKKEESDHPSPPPSSSSSSLSYASPQVVTVVVLSTLARHLTTLFIDRFERLVTLTEGPVVNTVRSNSIAGQISNFNDQIDLLNDIFDSTTTTTAKNSTMSRRSSYNGSYAWNVCICETLLQGFLSRLLLALDSSSCSSGSGSPAALAPTPAVATSSSQQQQQYPHRHHHHHVLLNCGADVGVMDADVIPEPEARAQVATLCLTRLLDHLEFLPLKRMLAVALFHPQSTTLWWQHQYDDHVFDNNNTNNNGMAGTTTTSSHISHQDRGSSYYQYVLTPALNVIAQGSSSTSNNNNSQDNSNNHVLIENPYRRELLRALQGDYGEYRFIPTAMLMEATLHALDPETIQALDILDAIQESLSSFLARRQHQLKSVVSSIALQAAASLSVQLLCMLSTMRDGSGSRTQQPISRTTGTTRSLDDILIRRALETARDYFFRKTLESQQIVGVSDMFVDLVESAVHAWYKQTTLPVVQGSGGGGSGPVVYAFVLSRHHCGSHPHHEALIRKMRGVSRNDVEETRFYAEMAIFYRACCRLVDRYAAKLQQLQQSTVTTTKKPSKPNTATAHQSSPLLFDPLDMADDLAQIFSAIRKKPDAGTDLDLRGRMVFPFQSPAAAAAARPSSAINRNDYNNRPRTWSEDMIIGSSSQLLLVLDPMEMFVVKPAGLRGRGGRGSHNNNTNGGTAAAQRRGTVICCIPLLSVIAAAADHEWLHMAVVRHPDVGFLIKNGNLALRFESSGTCLIVRQYLERCRQVLRAELIGKIKVLFQCSSTTTTASAAASTASSSVALEPPPEDNGDRSTDLRTTVDTDDDHAGAKSTGVGSSSELGLVKNDKVMGDGHLSPECQVSPQPPKEATSASIQGATC